ncbi:L-idonate 5-dehydrogenase [Acuticoccus sp. M5D2P5]|uniref:L-idonate 5-dehydrogenase n=1 Tax=Acuticoccus kalidii TaxID=2910977 RepID=UPI001F47DEF7|nr:L-idonate 5-dehydrogenase [Acuticoccus kalidii]MCF3935960.1 L-idonate 5-dehydrogenase [Acuticoccus kalidii]
MRAIIAHAAKDLRIGEIDPCAAPGPGEVAVRLKVGGICGSDLHYYLHGGFGTVRIKEPMILGHEVAGEIAAIGDGVAGLEVGMPVAVNPSRPCRRCRQCTRGRANLCPEVIFNGSAMRFPHVQGLFRESVVVPAALAVPVSCTLSQAAMIEPFSVALHAVSRAPSLLGADVLISGAGPIGCLVAIAAKLAGARAITMTDIAEPPLAIARTVGADETVDARDVEALEAMRDRFDVAFDCSGAAAALEAAFGMIGPGGTLVVVGNGGDPQMPTSRVVAREIEVRGSFRFDGEFALAARLLSSGRVDLSPLVTATRPLADAVAAFDLASDKARSMKVQLDLAA